MVTQFKNIQVSSDAERIFILRKRLNLSQFQFAKELGISTSYLGQVERGEQLLTTKLKKRINDYIAREKKFNEQNLHRNG